MAKGSKPDWNTLVNDYITAQITGKNKTATTRALRDYFTKNVDNVVKNFAVNMEDTAFNALTADQKKAFFKSVTEQGIQIPAGTANQDIIKARSAYKYSMKDLISLASKSNSTNSTAQTKLQNIIKVTTIDPKEFQAALKNAVKNKSNVINNNLVKNLWFDQGAMHIIDSFVADNGIKAPKELNTYRDGNIASIYSNNGSIYDKTQKIFKNQPSLQEAYINYALDSGNMEVIADINSQSYKDYVSNLNNETIAKKMLDNDILDVSELDTKNKYYIKNKTLRNNLLTQIKADKTLAAKFADSLLDHKMVTKNDNTVLEELAKKNTHRLDAVAAKMANDQELLDAFNKEVKNNIGNSLTSNSRNLAAHVKYLVDNKLITSQDASLLTGNITAANADKVRGALTDPDLQKAIDQRVLHNYTENDLWKDSTNSETKAYKQYLDKHNISQAERTRAIYDKLKSGNQNYSIDQFNKELDALQDANVKAELQQGVKELRDPTKNIKSGFSRGDNPWLDDAFDKKTLDAKGRQAYLDNIDASKAFDPNGDLTSDYQKLGLTEKEKRALATRANRPDVAHPRIHALGKAKQNLADIFANPGNTAAYNELSNNLKTAAFGKGGPSTNSIGGLKNAAAGTAAGIGAGLASETFLNSPIRNWAGNAQTGYRLWDTATDTLTNPYTGMINNVLANAATQGFLEAPAGVGSKLLGGAAGAWKYGVANPRMWGTALGLAALNQARDAANISNRSAIWQGIDSAAPWLQGYMAGGPISGMGVLAIPAATSAATAMVTQAATNAQEEALGIRDIGKRYAAGKDITGKDKENYRGYLFLGRNGEVKNIDELVDEIKANKRPNQSDEDYLDTHYAAYSPEMLTNFRNNDRNYDPEYIKTMDELSVKRNSKGDIIDRVNASDTGNHLTDIFNTINEYRRVFGTPEGLARFGGSTLTGWAQGLDYLFGNHTRKADEATDKAMLYGMYKRRKANMTDLQKPKSVKQEQEQEVAKQQAQQQVVQAAEQQAAIQQALQASQYQAQAPQVGVDYSSLMPIGGQDTSGIQQLLQAYGNPLQAQNMASLWG